MPFIVLDIFQKFLLTFLLSPSLQPSIFRRRTAQMGLHVFAEEGKIRKFQIGTDFLDAHIGMREKAVDVLHRIFRNPVIGSLATVTLADIRQIFTSNAKFLALVFQFPWLHIIGSQQIDKLLEKQTAS